MDECVVIIAKLQPIVERYKKISESFEYSRKELAKL